MPTLRSMVGQDSAIQVLQRAIAADKLAHAYLFTGPEGVGKATCAIRLAAALNCLDAFGVGCDACYSCNKVEQGLHPDLLHIQPDGLFIKIDQVRVLEQHLGFPPHEGRYRLVLIDGADRLNLNAANALLKSVEEPSPRTLFVLTSSAGHRVAPTLVSRCQRIRFLPLSTADVLTVIEQNAAATSPADLQSAAGLAEGSAGRAMRLLEGDQISFIQRTFGSLWSAATGSSDTQAIFEVAAEAGRDRQLLQETLDVLRVWLRDLLLCNQGLDGPDRLVNTDRRDLLHDEASRLSRVTLLRQLQAVQEAQNALRGNVHPTLALENLCLRMRQVAAQ